MAVHRNNFFEGTDVELDGNEFHHCQFKNCRLIYRGGELLPMTHCTFTQSHFLFDDAAKRTLQFLRGIYHGMGVGGQEVVERIFFEVRRRDELPKQAN